MTLVRRLTQALVAGLFALLAATAAFAGPLPPAPMDAADMRLALRKLEVVGTALFVGAHPDDENSSMIAWLSKGRMVRTVYLSLTRGDGGQNLIGSDSGERLGALRTQELLAARRVDGGEQWFARALDFGFSKNADETLALWGRDRILADVVWAIRSIRPDVIVTRFAPDSTAGHGHHTASAILAEEAFDAAADSTRFPEQLRRGVRPWRARRLVRNVGRFGAAGPDTTPGRLRVDLGAYDPLLGRSYTEIAGESRSMHKTQGFGSAERRGRWENTFEHRRGERAAADLFDGVDLTWDRVPGGARLEPLLARARREYDPARPQRTLAALLDAWTVLEGIPDQPIVRTKRAELREAIRACCGLWVEAIASAHTVSPGGRLRVATSALVRGGVPARLLGVSLEAASGSTGHVGSGLPAALSPNLPRNDTLDVAVPDDAPLSGPYWLTLPADGGAATVADPAMIGRPENDPWLTARFRIELLGRSLTFETPVVQRSVDPVFGERYRDLSIVPPATMRFGEIAYLFPDGQAREISVNVQATDRGAAGRVSLDLPVGWSAEPAGADVSLRAADSDTVLRFRVTPAAPAGPVSIGAVFEARARRWDRGLVRLDYPHVPVQTLLPRTRARLVRTDLRREGGAIAYLMGSGDPVPEALRQMGFAVSLLDDDAVERSDLGAYDAVVVGVRAYNTRPRLRQLQRRLLEYVAAGGRLVIQYQTPDAALNDRLGPYPFKVSRERVTVEDAPVRMLDPAQPLLARPNRISAADFDGWIQERGLWFASPWDKAYATPLSCNDPGEPPRDGGLLVARHGRGTFIYTGYAFFRQLPAGVPGAWRLFANLVSRESAATGPAGER